MYKHILIPTDGSELAGKGLDHGLALAKAIGASVTVVTVTDFPSAMAMTEDARRGVNPLEEHRKAMDKQARAVLDAVNQKAGSADVKIQTVHVAERPPAEGIIEAAKEHGCDLIVMSSHGRRGVRRLMLGSQTAEVVTTTSIPVLVVR